MLPFHQKGHRFISGVQGPPDDERAFRDEKPFLQILTVQQLCLGQTGVNVQLWCCKVCYLHYPWHGPHSPLPRHIDKYGGASL